MYGESANRSSIKPGSVAILEMQTMLPLSEPDVVFCTRCPDEKWKMIYKYQLVILAVGLSLLLREAAGAFALTGPENDYLILKYADSTECKASIEVTYTESDPLSINITKDNQPWDSAKITGGRWFRTVNSSDFSGLGTHHLEISISGIPSSSVLANFTFSVDNKVQVEAVLDAGNFRWSICPCSFFSQYAKPDKPFEVHASVENDTNAEFAFDLKELATLIQSCNGNFLDKYAANNSTHNLIAVASNDITNENSFAQVTFIYQPEIDIVFGETVMLVGSTYVINVSISQNVSVGIFVNFVKLIVTNHGCFRLNASNKYTEAGSVTISVFVSTLSYNKSDTRNIEVVYPYSGFTIGLNESEIQTTENATFYVSRNQTADLYMGKLTVTISPCGISSLVEELNVLPGQTQLFPCSFLTQGNYTVNISTQSLFGIEDSLTMDVYVWDRLNVSLHINETYFSVGSQPVFQVVDPPLSGFKYHIDFGETTIIEETDPGILMQPYSGISLPSSLNYSRPGKYYIRFMAYNDFYTVNKETIVTAFYGLPKSYFQVNPNRTLLIPVDGLVQFEIYSNDGLVAPKPSNVFCDIDFDDGTVLTNVSTEFDYNATGFGLRLEHNYVSGGTYEVILNCSNPVSRLVLMTMIRAINFSVQLFNISYRSINLHNESESGLFQIELQLYNFTRPPNNVILKWNFGDGSGLVQNVPMTNFSIQHIYPNRGHYSVYLEIKYIIDNDIRSINLEISMGAFNISLVSSETSGLVSVTQFSFEIANYLHGTTADIYVIWGDNTSEQINLSANKTMTVYHTFVLAGLFTPQIKAMSSKGTEMSSTTDSIFIENPVKNLTWNIPASIQFGFTFFLEVIYTGSLDINNVTCTFDYDGDVNVTQINFSQQSTKLLGPEHIFATMGGKTISVNCSNQLSHQTLTQTIIVLTGCFTVARLFDERYRHIRTPLKAYTSLIRIISGRIEFSPKCQNSTEQTFDWTVEEQRPFGWSKLNVPSPNAKVFDLAMCELGPGFYRLSCNLTVYGSKVQSIKDKMYLQLIDPPITAWIAGGAKLTVNSDADIFLDAVSNSYDPVIGYGNENHLDFSWRCFEIVESDVEKYLTPESDDSSYENGTACTLSFTSAGVVTVPASSLQPNAWFLFEVVVSKDVRSARAIQAIRIVDDGRPEFFLYCKWNCEMKRSRRVRMIYDTHLNCTNCTDDELTAATYQWQLQKYNGINYGLVPNVPVLSDPTVGVFEVAADVLEPGKSYKLKVTVSNVGDLPSAWATAFFTVSEEPYGGTCTVNPSTGQYPKQIKA
ncbi:uncharacterized protein LOC121378736 [Gigantopelta aegis]|uniref:uncharacterized protein LOC121378736 n=1 Tax=Gigantopelta aegis TaxID=1735272 RepID=UPI001B889EB3|nr:uncharacterized protein LOC121378736 [Gigantopelta aegis]